MIAERLRGQRTYSGPAGTAVNARAFNQSDAGLANPIINVPAGDYTLTIDMPGDQTGDYGFRLSKLNDAASLTPGAPVSGDLNPASETDLFQFTAAAGDRFHSICSRAPMAVTPSGG